MVLNLTDVGHLGRGWWALGASYVFRKPLDGRELLTALQTVLPGRQSAHRPAGAGRSVETIE
jgi:hypothetical protein